MIDLEQEVWLDCHRDSALQAGVVIALLNPTAQPDRHQRALTSCRLRPADFWAMTSDSASRVGVSSLIFTV